MQMAGRGKYRDQLRDTAVMQGEIVSAGIRMVAMEKVQWKQIWEMGLIRLSIHGCEGKETPKEASRSWHG